MTWIMAPYWKCGGSRNSHVIGFRLISTHSVRKVRSSPNREWSSLKLTYVVIFALLKTRCFNSQVYYSICFKLSSHGPQEFRIVLKFARFRMSSPRGARETRRIRAVEHTSLSFSYPEPFLRAATERDEELWPNPYQTASDWLQRRLLF